MAKKKQLKTVNPNVLAELKLYREKQNQDRIYVQRLPDGGACINGNIFGDYFYIHLHRTNRRKLIQALTEIDKP